MTGNELRAKYLKFFEERGHTVVPSASLVPENDPTTLFTGSGMQPMLPYLLGEKSPYGSRIVDSQRCFRVQDIEEVGDNRHTTAFEMLGNWSLGDYFKKEQLTWFWEFLTKEVGLDPQKLYVTVFAGEAGISKDEEAIAIWTELFNSVGIEPKVVENAVEAGMQDGRIFTYPAKKNWWSRSGVPEKMPVGEPGGPDSEVFYEFTDVEHDPAFGEFCHVNCDCGRFLEIGNNVFMQYQKQADGSFKELPQRNIDFGGGLERMLAAKINTPDVFKTDLFWPIIERIERSGGDQGGYRHNEYPYRVISDHIKVAIFLLSDGVIPSNKTQGYVLRRVIRRAVNQGRKLGITQPFMGSVGEVVIEIYREAYPQVANSGIIELLQDEEVKFLQTLDRGLKEVIKYDQSLQGKVPSLDEIAAKSFDFYQTLGLPSDVFLDELIALGLELSIDDRLEIQEKYNEHFAKHQDLSREGSVGMFKGGLGGHSGKEIEYHTATHLLQQALRDVLGDSVIQRGSNITPERLRFDFTSESRLTDEQKKQVEEIVNSKIAEALPVSFTILSKEEAEKTGAIHAFGEKYGDAVKVYSIGGTDGGMQVGGYAGMQEDATDNLSGEVKLAEEMDSIVPRSEVYSREFCGGPHVANTSEIKGRFKIQKDEKISRDVVRIKAVLE